jgi:hypothetical protein
MRALTQIDLDAHKIETLATGAGTMLDEHGNIVVDEHGNPLFISDVAADFDPNQYYPAGQYINYNNRVWRLIKAHAPYTPWDPENATEEKFGIYSKVLQNADNITLKVAKGDVATQLAVEVGNVTITGGNLTVDGMITAEGLETMDITVASLHADYVSVGNGGVVLDDTGSSVTASSYTMNDYSGDLVDSIKGVQVIASGNNYKLQYKTFSGDTWTDAGTFSRATLMSGTWASGVLTVLPDSAGSSSLYYYLSQGSTSWSGAYGSIPVLYSTEQSGQTQSTGYTFSVYRGGSITAASPVSQQPTGSNLRSVTVGSGGNHTYIKLSSTGYRNNNDYITINY